MISDIDKSVRKSVVSSFADDTKVSHVVNLLQDCLDLQSSLNEIYTWSDDNNMNFNDLKFQAIRYGKVNEQIQYFKYKTPNDEDILFESNVKDLGVTMTNNLLFRDYIERIISMDSTHIHN